MNKIKLIKSFANYSLGEYVLNINEEEYVMTDDYGSYYIHKDIVEGMKDHFEEVKERPTSWEELGEIDGYWVEYDSSIEKQATVPTHSSENKSTFKTKEQCEAAVALAQITQLLDKYDIPEISHEWFYKGGVVVNRLQLRQKGLLLGFDTEAKCKHFYKHHADLISKLAPFYIF